MRNGITEEFFFKFIVFFVFNRLTNNNDNNNNKIIGSLDWLSRKCGYRHFFARFY